LQLRRAASRVTSFAPPPSVLSGNRIQNLLEEKLQGTSYCLQAHEALSSARFCPWLAICSKQSSGSSLETLAGLQGGKQDQTPTQELNQAVGWSLSQAAASAVNGNIGNVAKMQARGSDHPISRSTDHPIRDDYSISQSP
jgi:hypothetical protein